MPMKKIGTNAPIGVFDSGLGGISVLREAARIMPNEKFIYFGDSANAPYGEKPDSRVFELTDSVFQNLLSMGCKAIMVACNTATSVAVTRLRLQYPELPLVGIEPALKPAVEQCPGGRIVVMATPVTLRRPKFEILMEHYRSRAEIIPMPCPGLMEFVEENRMDDPDLDRYLEERFLQVKDRPVDAVVTGCTHYPFLADRILKAAGPSARLFDGAGGTSRELKRRIEIRGLQAPEDEIQTVSFLNSAGEDYVRLSEMMFRM